MKKLMASVMATVFCFATLSGCSQTTSQLVNDLNAVADGAEASVVVATSLVAAGVIGADVAAQVSVYATAVGVACNTATAELNSNDPNPVKITVISAAFAKAASYAFGSNQPIIAAAITALSNFISVFLTDLNSSTVLKLAKVAPIAKVNFAPGDKAKLKQINQKVAVMMVQAAALKAVK
jgi:hypothetical protein